jgi:hypothetical protein
MRSLVFWSIAAQHRQNVGGLDLIDRDVADRPCVLAERLPPLPHVLLVLPRRFVRCDELIGHRAECGLRAGLHGLGGALLSDGIDLVGLHQLAQFSVLDARLA